MRDLMLRVPVQLRLPIAIVVIAPLAFVAGAFVAAAWTGPLGLIGSCIVGGCIGYLGGMFAAHWEQAEASDVD